jgi:hypothetical protein
VTKPNELSGDARRFYDTWRRIGLSEAQAIETLRRDGLIETSDYDRTVNIFRTVFHLSESAARLASDGREAPSARSVLRGERSSVGPEPGDNLRLVAKIEELASDICSGGASKDAALQAAFFHVFDAAPHSLKDWVAGIAGRRWPKLFGSAG